VGGTTFLTPNYLALLGWWKKMVAIAYLSLRVLVHGMSVVVKSSWIIVEDAVDDREEELEQMLEKFLEDSPKNVS